MPVCGTGRDSARGSLRYTAGIRHGYWIGALTGLAPSRCYRGAGEYRPREIDPGAAQLVQSGSQQLSGNTSQTGGWAI